jgi:hypothetical protein
MKKIFIILIFILFVSCNVEKKNERADAAALNRVETNIKLLTAAYVRALLLYPCVNDSVTIIKKDTIVTQTINTVIKKDTINHRDTVINTILKTFHYRDSIRTVVKDQEGIKALTDSLNNYKLQLANISGSLIESRNSNKELNSKIVKAKTDFYILLVVLILAAAALVYIKFIPKV